ncbi:MAG: thiol protease/hemagglutinin PrtT [Flavobacteriales bacterium]|nr:thiol protease/hemagglutinin PrtT [Flavobacteriales bacterium]
MKRNLLPILVLLALAGVNRAADVSPEKAGVMASGAYNSVRGADPTYKTSSANLKLAHTGFVQTQAGQKPAYYVFSESNGNGYVIIAGDDAVSPILGYSVEGTFEPDNLPPAYVFHLNRLSEQIAYAKDHGLKGDEQVMMEWNGNGKTAAVTAIVVSPLIKTRWGQGDPYNMNCPVGTVTGCVATGMSQVMYYWNYPANGQGSKTYNSPGEGTQSANFATTYYDWNAMTKTYSSSSSTASKRAVALLMYHCGVSVSMDYGPSSSAKTVPDALQGYHNHFRYPEAYTKKRSSYSLSGWIAKFKDELDENAPIHMRGSGGGGGHSWICDGYDSGSRFHMNWGWGGSKDAYFVLDALEPGNSVFNTDVQAIFGIRKPNRIILSISPSTSVLCSKSSFTVTANNLDPKIISITSTAPTGWTMSAPISTGVNKTATFYPPSNFDPNAQDYIQIKAEGNTAYGERTVPRYLKIGTGVPDFTYKKSFPDPSTAEYTFTASPGAKLKYSFNNISWTTAGNVLTLEAPAATKRNVYVKAFNSCGTGPAKTILLQGPPKIIDLQTVSSNEQHIGEALLYPNPAKDVVSIAGNEIAKEIACYNSVGQKMDVLTEGNTLNISDLPTGIYLVQITYADGSKSIGRFLKQ